VYDKNPFLTTIPVDDWGKKGDAKIKKGFSMNFVDFWVVDQNR